MKKKYKIALKQAIFLLGPCVENLKIKWFHI